MRFSCYENEEVRQSTTTLRSLFLNTDASEVALGELWANGKVLADTCYEKMNETGDLVGTAFTARDIMSIVDALDEGPLLNCYGKSSMRHLRNLLNHDLRNVIRNSIGCHIGCYVS